MSHSPSKLVFLSVIFLTSAVAAFAQDPVSRSNRENSPYSRYGMGEERNGFNTLLKGMGTVSSAYANPYAINSDNPASYSYIKLTTYEAGGEGSMRTVTGGGEKYKTGMATLSYFSFGIPAGKYLGLSFGLRPETREHYWLDDTTNVAGYGNAIKSQRSDGSMNYAYLGAAGQYKNLSVGVNFGYLFGTSEQTSYLLSTDKSAYVYNSLFTRFAKRGGIYWKTGALYDINLKKDRKIRLGATATLSQDINITSDEVWVSYSSTTGYADSAYSKNTVKGKITLPMSYGFGIQFLQSDKWLAAIDIKAAQWGQYRNIGKADSLSDNTYRIALGGEYTPDALSLRKYFHRVTYRLGVYYGKDKVFLRNTEINYYAVTGGISLPFKRSTDRVHLGLEVGKRGTETNGLLKESFVRFSFGISLNDRWFVKNPYR